jgi:hypothetical protein
MLLKHKASGDLVAVVELDELFNPLKTEITARDQAGQEEQDPERFAKRDLVFASGEGLPRCWTDPKYKMTTS